MKWSHAQEVFTQDPWLKHVIFEDERLRKDEAIERKVIEINVSHIMFRKGQLNPDWKAIHKELAIDSAPKVGHSEFDEYTDFLGYSISYFLVCRVANPLQVLVKKIEVGSLRWGAVRLQAMLHKSQEWIAVVRQISIISQGEYLMNGYDVFRFPPYFTPLRAGWHQPESAIKIGTNK